MQYCDLHVHSDHSDGTCTVAEVLEIAKKAGLSAVALTDHNTVSGLPEFMAAAKDIEAIPGTEFSSEYDGTELHILALYIKPEHYDVVTERAERFMRDKEQSNINLCAALTAAGYDLDYEKIKAATADGFVNRGVIGAEMVRLGYIESIRHGFKSLLNEKMGYYVPPKRPDALEIIRFIKSIGAVAVLAHPYLSMKQPQIEAFLPLAVEAGLDGMEVIYSRNSDEETAASFELIEKYGLLPSGGSDFHGGNKPDIDMGTGTGNLKIPYNWAQTLKMKKT